MTSQPKSPKSKQKSTPPRNRSKIGSWIALIVLLGAIYASYHIGNRVISMDFHPEFFELPSPPSMNGVYAPNKRLRNAQLLLKGRIFGPESILVEKDAIYTGTLDGKIAKIVNEQIVKIVSFTDRKECGTYSTEPLCGRPLGIRRLNSKLLIVADAYLGIFTVNFDNGISKNVLKTNDPRLNGKHLKFVNDLDVLNEETIFFSDSSSKWDRRRFLHQFLEQQGNGRLFQLNVATNELKLVLGGLFFANGVQIHPDRQSVLVSECSMSRIVRYYFDGPSKGKSEYYANNLPGFPDNIRLSHDRTKFYVGLAGIRSAEKSSLIDFIGDKPWIRKALVALVPDQFLVTGFSLLKPKYGIFLIIDTKSGKIIDSVQDRDGLVIDDISQVSDDENYYYLGSFHANFIAKVSKKNF